MERILPKPSSIALSLKHIIEKHPAYSLLPFYCYKIEIIMEFGIVHECTKPWTYDNSEIIYLKHYYISKGKKKSELFVSHRIFKVNKLNFSLLYLNILVFVGRWQNFVGECGQCEVFFVTGWKGGRNKENYL